MLAKKICCIVVSGTYGHGDFKSVDKGREAYHAGHMPQGPRKRHTWLVEHNAGLPPGGPVLLITAPHRSRRLNRRVLRIAACSLRQQ